MTTKVFEADIEINAPVELVWQHLTDFASYPDWNPFIVWAEGELKEGSIVTFRVTDIPIKITAPITTLIPNEALIWEANMPFPGLMPRYSRRLEKLSETRTRFINHETFSGRLMPIVGSILTRQVDGVYMACCEALKARVEASATA